MNKKLSIKRIYSAVRSTGQKIASDFQGMRAEATMPDPDPIPAHEDAPAQPDLSVTTEAPAQLSPEGETARLKQQLREMQEELERLKKQQAQHPRPIDFKKILPQVIRLGIILVLAAIPLALVFQHNWLGDPYLTDFNRGQWWCKVEFLCQTALPSYFMIIFACLVVIGILMLWTKIEPAVLLNPNQVEKAKPNISQSQARAANLIYRGGILGLLVIVLINLGLKIPPGWDLVLVIAMYFLGLFLQEVPLDSVFRYIQKNLDYILALVLFHAALVALLGSIYAAPQFLRGAAILFILAGANLFRFLRRVSPGYWLFNLSLVFFTLNINSWWTSWVGDEYASYYTSSRLAQASFGELNTLLFNAQGNYGNAPFIASMPQAITMRLLGFDGFGWRFGEMYVSALAVGLFYLFYKTFVERRTALIAAFLIGVSHYIMAFSKIGYGIMPALFAEALVLATAAWVIKTKSPLAFSVAGFAIGFCFYVYPGALYAVPLPVLLLLIYIPPINKKALGGWARMLGTLAILIFPLLLQPEYWQGKLAGTFLSNPQFVENSGTFIDHFAKNLLYAAFIFLYNPYKAHFVVSSTVDPLTALLVPLGFICILKWTRRKPFALFIMLSYVIMLVVAGASHQYDFPPMTRMMLLLPWYALFAAIGLNWVLEQLTNLGIFRPKQLTILVVLFALVAGSLNYYQGNILNYWEYAGLQSFQTLFMRLAYRTHELEPEIPKNYVVLEDIDISVYMLDIFQQIYPLPLKNARFSRIILNSPQLPDESKSLLSDRNTIVLILPETQENMRQNLEAPLREIGKEPCWLRMPDGKPYVLIYHAPELAGVCQ